MDTTVSTSSSGPSPSPTSTTTAAPKSLLKIIRRNISRESSVERVASSSSTSHPSTPPLTPLIINDAAYREIVAMPYDANASALAAAAQQSQPLLSPQAATKKYSVTLTKRPTTMTHAAAVTASSAVGVAVAATVTTPLPSPPPVTTSFTSTDIPPPVRISSPKSSSSSRDTASRQALQAQLAEVERRLTLNREQQQVRDQMRAQMEERKKRRESGGAGCEGVTMAELSPIDPSPVIVPSSIESTALPPSFPSSSTGTTSYQLLPIPPSSSLSPSDSTSRMISRELEEEFIEKVQIQQQEQVKQVQQTASVVVISPRHSSTTTFIPPSILQASAIDSSAASASSSSADNTSSSELPDHPAASNLRQLSVSQLQRLMTPPEQPTSNITPSQPLPSEIISPASAVEVVSPQSSYITRSQHRRSATPDHPAAFQVSRLEPEKLQEMMDRGGRSISPPGNDLASPSNISNNNAAALSPKTAQGHFGFSPNATASTIEVLPSALSPSSIMSSASPRNEGQTMESSSNTEQTTTATRSKTSTPTFEQIKNVPLTRSNRGSFTAGSGAIHLPPLGSEVAAMTVLLPVVDSVSPQPPPPRLTNKPPVLESTDPASLTPTLHQQQQQYTPNTEPGHQRASTESGLLLIGGTVRSDSPSTSSTVAPGSLSSTQQFIHIKQPSTRNIVNGVSIPPILEAAVGMSGSTSALMAAGRMRTNSGAQQQQQAPGSSSGFPPLQQQPHARTPSLAPALTSTRRTTPFLPNTAGTIRSPQLHSQATPSNLDACYPTSSQLENYADIYRLTNRLPWVLSLTPGTLLLVGPLAYLLGVIGYGEFNDKKDMVLLVGLALHGLGLIGILIFITFLLILHTPYRSYLLSLLQHSLTLCMLGTSAFIQSRTIDEMFTVMKERLVSVYQLQLLGVIWLFIVFCILLYHSPPLHTARTTLYSLLDGQVELSAINKELRMVRGMYTECMDVYQQSNGNGNGNQQTMNGGTSGGSGNSRPQSMQMTAPSTAGLSEVPLRINSSGGSSAGSGYATRGINSPPDAATYVVMNRAVSPSSSMYVPDPSIPPHQQQHLRGVSGSVNSSLASIKVAGRSKKKQNRQSMGASNSNTQQANQLMAMLLQQQQQQQVPPSLSHDSSVDQIAMKQVLAENLLLQLKIQALEAAAGGSATNAGTESKRQTAKRASLTRAISPQLNRVADLSDSEFQQQQQQHQQFQGVSPA